MKNYVLVFVAILALSLSLGTLTLLAARTIANTRNAEMRFTAEFLAVEALEVIRQKYESLMLENSISLPPGTAIPSTELTGCANGCGLNYVQLVNGGVSGTIGLVNCIDMSFDCARVQGVNIDPDGNAGSGDEYTIYHQQSLGVATGGTVSPFRRMVYTQQSLNNGIYVKSIVWYGKNNQKIEMVEELKNWYLPETP